MFWLWLVLGVVVGCGILMFVAGSLLPRNHVATSTVTLKAGPAAVWAAITDWRALSKWRKEVTAVEELPTKDGWIETSRFGRVPLRVERSEPRGQRTVRCRAREQL